MNSTRENILNSIKALGMKVLPKDAQLIGVGDESSSKGRTTYPVWLAGT